MMDRSQRPSELETYPWKRYLMKVISDSKLSSFPFPPFFSARFSHPKKKKKNSRKRATKRGTKKKSDGIRNGRTYIVQRPSLDFFSVGDKKNAPEGLGRCVCLYYYRPLMPSLEALCLSWATFQDILFNDDCYQKLQQQSVNFCKIFRALSPENDRLFAKKSPLNRKKSFHSLKLTAKAPARLSHPKRKRKTRWWFQIFFIFNPT